MTWQYYMNNPDLKEYFESLPVDVQKVLADSRVEIATLGELKQCAEHLMNQNG
jgi:hypothetical protein